MKANDGVVDAAAQEAELKAKEQEGDPDRRDGKCRCGKIRQLRRTPGGWLCAYCESRAEARKGLKPRPRRSKKRLVGMVTA